ncbi:hypothetical protein ABNQ39_20830 [Azospirillum sp. A26]|uniref:hypothetical protein n=1 Tax=Azospirillum sp. A26 TaxID=3160607 RepID=UPI00366ABE8D
MPQDYHTPQSYSFHGPLCEIAKGCDEPLCGSSASSFIAVLLLLAAILAAGTAYMAGGAEEVVYRRHAEVRALASTQVGER